MIKLLGVSVLWGLSFSVIATENMMPSPAAPALAYPTGIAISDLGALSQQEMADRARTALVRGGSYGGLQSGLAQAPAAGLYIALSIFMGGVDAPQDLTAPVDSLK